MGAGEVNQGKERLAVVPEERACKGRAKATAWLGPGA